MSYSVNRVPGFLNPSATRPLQPVVPPSVTPTPSPLPTGPSPVMSGQLVSVLATGFNRLLNWIGSALRSLQVAFAPVSDRP